MQNKFEKMITCVLICFILGEPRLSLIPTNCTREEFFPVLSFSSSDCLPLAYGFLLIVYSLDEENSSHSEKKKYKRCSFRELCCYGIVKSRECRKVKSFGVCLFVFRMLHFVTYRMDRTGFNLLGSKMINTSDSELRSSLDICHMTSNACSWNNCKNGAY